jgi:diguanylate cyclase (GGDEF)-like protein/PAS domain S-box-containing protein
MFDAVTLPDTSLAERQNILLVDDHLANLVSLEAILSDCGATLLTAATGEAALDLLYLHDVSLVLLDIQLPGMDGYEVLRTMRSQPRTQQIPTLFVTAYSRDEPAIVHGYNTGAIDYILKPVNASILRGKVAQFLELDHTRRSLQNAYSRLAQQKAYYESMLNAADEGVLGLSAEGRVDFANPTALRLLAADPERLLGHSFIEIGHSNEIGPQVHWEQTVFYRYWKARRALHLTDTQLQRLDGVPLPVALSSAPLAGDNGGSVIVFQDISYHKQLEQQLRQQAVTDPLTGLNNRHGFKQALAAGLRRAARANCHLALYFIDLDHFKDINDSLGHDSGDQILGTVAERLRLAVRANDTVSRLGGDEFTVIIDDMETPEYAALVARKMLQALAKPFWHAEQSLSLSASIGIAMFPDNSMDSDKLMLAADLAMYRAKNTGRNTFEFFTPELNIRAKARLMLEQGLRQGLEQQEFLLYYQPQYATDSLQLSGVEALLRWKRKQSSMVMPAVFVPLLEQTGLINTVGEWVIAQAAQQRRLWREQGVLPDDCPLAINLSPRQFESDGLLPALTQAIEQNQLLPMMLEIELTEGMLMKDSPSNSSTLSALRQQGVRLSIDDFGTGYSSLAYLMQFDIDALKIDKSFIDRIAISEKDAAITTSIIQLAHNMQLQVVAEGVETQAQQKILSQLGCDFLQGYLYAQPMPAAQMADFVQQQRHLTKKG